MNEFDFKIESEFHSNIKQKGNERNTSGEGESVAIRKGDVKSIEYYWKILHKLSESTSSHKNK